jgi:hypothetical protein
MLISIHGNIFKNAQKFPMQRALGFGVIDKKGFNFLCNILLSTR